MCLGMYANERLRTHIFSLMNLVLLDHLYRVMALMLSFPFLLVCTFDP
jgi:hypothetical protein